jgi:hypothetical protein
LYLCIEVLTQLKIKRNMATKREKGLLTKRVYDVNYSATNVTSFLKELKGVNVPHIEYLEQTSSAGDWSGLFFQKYNRKTYVIPFSQENNWPNGTFTLYTGEVTIIINGDIDRSSDEWKEMLNDLCVLWYE